MHLVGLILIIGGVVAKKRQPRFVKYGLITAGWAVVALQYLIAEKSWPFALASVFLGVLFIVFIVYDEKQNFRNRH